MTDPGSPSNPRTPFGYHLTTPSRDSVSVCFPIASPVAIPFREPRIRGFTIVALRRRKDLSHGHRCREEYFCPVRLLMVVALENEVAHGLNEMVEAETIAAYFDGGLSGRERTSIDRHFEICSQCC